ncbi:hypothetical protein C8R47DRAFT_1078522 [Mycena vitilis]|nr:hypothetical protein C8R47DRAFT_1078522 [Mycena vitilis]
MVWPDLHHEIHGDLGASVVYRRPTDRRVYSAILRGQSVTVAVYQGKGAVKKLQKWRQYITKHISLRHPNIIQIYGAASSGGIHATLFYGDLIPLEHWLDLHKHFPCLAVYMDAYYPAPNSAKFHEFRVRKLRFFLAPSSPASQEANQYLGHITSQTKLSSECTLWIRRSTGRLCVDLMRPHKRIVLGPVVYELSYYSETTALVAKNSPILEAVAIDALPPEAYHKIWRRLFGERSSIDIPAGVNSIHLGMVFSRRSDNHVVEIASLPEPDTATSDWSSSEVSWGNGEEMEHVWTRYQDFPSNSRDVVRGILSFKLRNSGHKEGIPWLRQSNRIFKYCQLTSNAEDYAYWSFDRLGTHPLSMGEAMVLGFPELQLRTEISALSWDSSLYPQFHQARRFDSHSQGVARPRLLRQEHYRPSANFDPPFAHVVEEEDYFEVLDDPHSPMNVDAGNQDDEGLSDMDLN